MTHHMSRATSIFQVLMTAVTWTTVRETYAPVILRRRAEKLRRETGDTHYRTSYERLEGKKSIVQTLTQALLRPLRLLAFHPSLQLVVIIMAFQYGLLYIVLARFATVWIEQYGESVEISGLHYIACAGGEMVGSQIGGWTMDALFRRMTRTRASTSTSTSTSPEIRLPLAVPGALLAPAGILIYGWAAQRRAPWAAVDVGTFVYMFGGQLAGLPLQAYVIDAYPEHAGSALAASQLPRSLAAFAFPLLATRMYAALGYGWGNSVLALAGLVLGVSLPLVLWRFGARLREKAGGTY